MQKFDLDYFFTLNPTEREVFFALIDRVSAIVTHEKLTPEQMAAKLPQEVFSASEFQKFDARLTTTMVEGILQMLNDDRSIPYLVTKLDDYDHRYLAAKMLGWFGAKAQSAIPKLVGLASGTSGAVEVAKQSIILIGNAEAEIISALQQSISANDDGEFRELSDLAIRYGCISNPRVLDLLQAATRSKNSDLREAIADAIYKMGAVEKQQFISVLDKLENDPDENVRQAASEASHRVL